MTGFPDEGRHLSSEGGEVEAVAVEALRQDMESAGTDFGEVQTIGDWIGFKFVVIIQKCPDDVLVFATAERAGRVDQATARPNTSGCRNSMENAP